MSKALTLAIFSLVLLGSSFLIPFHLYLPAWVSHGDSYTIDPESRRSISLKPPLGTTIRVGLIISGAGGHVQFRIEDHQGEVEVNQTLSSGTYFFDLQPGKTEDQVLVFENNSSYVQSVQWLISIYYYNALFLLLGIVSLFGSSVTALTRKKTEMQEDDIVLKARLPTSGTDLTNVKGIGPKTAQKIMTIGIGSAEELANEDAQELAEMLRVSVKTSSRLIENAKETVLPRRKHLSRKSRE